MTEIFDDYDFHHFLNRETMFAISPGLSSKMLRNALTHACVRQESSVLFRAMLNSSFQICSHQVGTCKPDLLQPGFLIYDK